MEPTKLKDADIREPLFDFLDIVYPRNRIIEERTIGKSRADVMMVLPGRIVGIEIKSDADTYARLTTQVRDYDRYFDQNYIVVGTSHALHIQERVPNHWGIITAEIVGRTVDFYILRRPQENKKMKPRKQLDLIWRPELVILQDLNHMPKYKNKSKAWVRNKIQEWVDAGKIEQAVLKEQMTELLFQRDYNDIEASLQEYKNAKNDV